MSIATFQKSVARAHKICEDAATVAALTRMYNNEPTTFVIPAKGVFFGQLVKQLRSLVSPMTTAVQEGETIRITTNNPRAATKVLKQLGVSVTVDGTVLADTHTNNEEVV
jgi:hypothetical protein